MALNCTPLTNIPENCDPSTGGIQTVGITDFANVTIDPASDITDGTVTNITMETTTLFHKFDFTKNSSSASEPMAVDSATGSTFYTHTVNVQIARREVAKRNSISLLAAGQRELMIIVKDNNNQYWLAGYSANFEEGVQLTGDDGGTGVAKGDMNGYNLTFTGEQKDRMLLIDPTIVDALFIAAL